MKIPWREFMDTPEELHAFVIGLCEILCPFPARFGPYWKLPEKEGDSASEAIAKEYHYYSFGRIMGVIAWLIIAKIIQEVFW